MKKLIIILILSLFVFTSYSQRVSQVEQRPDKCCWHYDEEFGETWTILYWATDLLDAQRLIDRYGVFDIANEYFKSDGDYYIELVDPTDTLEIQGKFKLFIDRHIKRLIYIDFVIDDNSKPICDENGNKLMIR